MLMIMITIPAKNTNPKARRVPDFASNVFYILFVFSV